MGNADDHGLLYFVHRFDGKLDLSRRHVHTAGLERVAQPTCEEELAVVDRAQISSVIPAVGVEDVRPLALEHPDAHVFAAHAYLSWFPVTDRLVGPHLDDPVLDARERSSERSVPPGTAPPRARTRRGMATACLGHAQRGGGNEAAHAPQVARRIRGMRKKGGASVSLAEELS